jgi:hypothetical protein
MCRTSKKEIALNLSARFLDRDYGNCPPETRRVVVGAGAAPQLNADAA